MTVPRAVACPRGWFPPATFQLRLRSLRTILYIGKHLFVIMFFKTENNNPILSLLASNTSRNGQESGYFYVTLHQDFNSPSAWTSPKVKWSTDSETRLEWSDIEITNESVHLGLKSILIKVWFAYNFEENSQEDQECLEATWGIHFSGLRYVFLIVILHQFHNLRICVISRKKLQTGSRIILNPFPFPEKIDILCFLRETS